MTKVEADDFSILYINYSFNLNIPSSVEIKVVKLNIEVNKLNRTDKQTFGLVCFTAANNMGAT